jgi:hypothetical protein
MEQLLAIPKREFKKALSAQQERWNKYVCAEGAYFECD